MPVTIVGNNTPTAGGVVYGDGTNYVSTAAGTSGQLLQSNGSGAPTWTTLGPSVSGSTTPAVGFPNLYTITNFDINTTYTLSGVTNGSASISGNTITYTPTSAGAAGFTLNGKVYSLTAATVVTGQQAYTTAGTYTWTCPTGVTSVAVVCVGGGGGGASTGSNSQGGGGGGLAYRNAISVTPGTNYTIVVGAAGTGRIWNGGGGTNGGSSSAFSCIAGGGSYPGTENTAGNGTSIAVANTSAVPSGTFTGGGAGGGVASGVAGQGGGGGAGGYSGAGGVASADTFVSGGNGAGGGGGGGSGSSAWSVGGGGGGVGLLGEGASGTGGSGSSFGSGGGGGSGGTSGANGNAGGTAGAYGGGGAGGGGGNNGTSGGVGAVRIIWPAQNGWRAFPSTNTGNL